MLLRRSELTPCGRRMLKVGTGEDCPRHGSPAFDIIPVKAIIRYYIKLAKALLASVLTSAEGLLAVSYESQAMPVTQQTRQKPSMLRIGPFGLWVSPHHSAPLSLETCLGAIVFSVLARTLSARNWGLLLFRLWGQAYKLLTSSIFAPDWDRNGISVRRTPRCFLLGHIASMIRVLLISASSFLPTTLRSKFYIDQSIILYSSGHTELRRPRAQVSRK